MSQDNEADKTIRSGTEQPEQADKTIRAGASQPSDADKTMRPEMGKAVADVDKTMRPGANADKTMRPGANVDKTMRPGADKTMRPGDKADQHKEIEALTKQWEDSYTLKGVTYKVIKVISDGTGEGQIFLVEHKNQEFVLKLYFLGIEPPPNHDILETIRKTLNSGLLIDVIDHGMWTNPHNANEVRHYEVMKYCKGGTLDNYDIKHNEEKLKEIALKAAFSIDFCHKHGIIHRDIKPGNFFFVDEAQQELVLGDFGISVMCDKNGYARVNQARTRIYAAPEVYYTVPGEDMAEIDVKSDFYSLGMVLLCVWMGEKNFKEKESELMRKKRTGDLPFPADLSDHMLQLIKALTAPMPEKRCGFDEIVRWSKGENILADDSKQETKRKFNIIFNAGKDQVAHSPEELAEFMRKDPNLAIQYMYSGKLTQWMNDNLRPELGMNIENIVEKVYPKDQQAGLFAACYVLDPDMPYYDAKGKPLTTNEEIARSLTDNFSYYEKVLSNPNDSLFLFFNAHGGAQLSTMFAPFFKKNQSNREALWRLIYALNPALPYVLTNEDGQRFDCQSPEEIIAVVYENVLSDESWDDLKQESFLVWLSGRDKGLVGKIRAELKGCDMKGGHITWCVLYNLSPKVAYNLQMDETADNYYFTHSQVADLLNAYFMDYMTLDESDSGYSYASNTLDMLLDLNETRLYFYLKSKGVYDSKIDWINYCFDMDSKDNTRKSAPYNWRIATFKALKGLDTDPFYYFKDSNKYAFSLDDLNSISSKEIKKELQDNYLADWITIFFEEDPAADLSKKYAFEKLTVDYLEFVEKLDDKQNDVSNYRIATNRVNKNQRMVKTKYRAFTWMRVLLGALCFVPLIAFIGALIYFGLPFNENPMPGFNGTAIIVMTIIFGLIIWISGDFESLLGSAFLGVIVAFAAYYAVYLILWLIMPVANYILAGILLLVAIYLIKSCYFNLPTLRSSYKNVLNPGFEEKYLEPLHFAFKAKEGEYFESSIGDSSYEYNDYLKQNIKKFSFRAIPTILVVCGLAFLFFKEPLMSNSAINRLMQQEEVMLNGLTGKWSGTFEGRPAVLDVTSSTSDGIEAIIQVKYKNTTNETLRGKVDLALGIPTIHMDDVYDNGTLDGEYTGVFNAEMTQLDGTYENYKTKKQVSFQFIKD